MIINIITIDLGANGASKIRFFQWYRLTKGKALQKSK